MADGITRRQFILRSAGYTALFCATPLLGRLALAGDEAAPEIGSPIDEAPDFSRVRRVGAFDFAEGFRGDDFERPHRTLVNLEGLLAKLPGGKIPDPTEKASVVVVGGGIAGLASAWVLRDLSPVLLEQSARFGGNSQGEKWRDSTYATGAAYFIAPDEGDELDALYRETGASEGARLVEGHDPVEQRGKLWSDFFSGESSPSDAAAFAAYAAKIKEHGDTYPDIPIVEEEGRELVLSLDKRSLADVVTEWLGGKVPQALEAAIQNYCWSSFGAGWREISAASGINFLAAEQFGVLVQPGGNAWLARAFLRKLREAVPAGNVRPGCLVFRVVPASDGVQVAYLDPDDQVRVVAAKAAVLACPKFVAKRILPELEADRVKAIDELEFRGYVVVNVLLDAPVDHEFYDLYLLRDAAVSDRPGGQGTSPGRVTDVILGNWARAKSESTESVLTLYWPMPFPGAREDILGKKSAFDVLAPLAEKQIREILPVLGIKEAAVKQVRLARWGHAVPVAKPGFIAAGHADVLRRPFAERVFFVNQDNWALPAIETSLTEAIHFAPLVRQIAG